MSMERRYCKARKSMAVAVTVLVFLGSFVMTAPPAAAWVYDDPLTSSYVKITSGSGSFSSLSTSSKQIYVDSGESIYGSIVLETHNSMSATDKAPLIGTTSWGSHSSSYWEIENWISTGTNSYVSSNIAVNAPTAAGTYYLIFAFGAEYTGAQLASCTNWRYADVHGEIWNDGNDIAQLSAAKISQMQSSGRTTVNYLFDQGSQSWTIPGDAVTVVVSDAGTIPSPFSTSQITLGSGTESFSTISQSNKQITVAPGSRLTGSISVDARNNMGSSAGPLVATSTWGTSSSSYWVIRNEVTPGTAQYTTSGISMIAPSNPGTYYIIIAFSDEYDGAQVASCTSQGYGDGSAVWDDGNDLADLSSAQISSAQTNGRASVQYLFAGGLQQYVIPVAAITIIVKGSVVTHLDDPLTQSYVKIQSGTGSFSSVTTTNKQIVVEPGAALTGSVAMLAKNDLKSTDAAPLVGLTSWGSHSSNFWSINNWISTGTNSYVSSNIAVNAPSSEGTYYLIFAFNAELNGAQVASCTNWRHEGGVVWNDGNDIASFSSHKIAEIQSNGRTTVSYLFTTWSQEWTVPSDAIKIVVADEKEGVALLGTISGRVVYSNADPVGGASVVLSSGSTVLTDTDGWFSIDLSPGSYDLTLRKTGCEERHVQVAVGTGQSLNMGEIVMQEVSTTSDPTSSQLLPWAFGGMILVGVVLAALLLVQRRGR
ncbi:MAG: carboxypeptidase regulatory-like domain-containing protein [Methanomassiliicoccus sp.]|nr:carboxypeptidase regulatory-like domain-containing protein [Methanomassiliicoccus sp.]